jgi:acetyl-CoA acetyltransferase
MSRAAAEIGLRSRTAVVGVATIGFGRYPDKTALELADEAVRAALSDAGLKRRDIDGVVVNHGSPRGMDYDATARLLGLNIRFGAQSWNHGRFSSSVVQHAALAIHGGLAETVVCLAASRNTQYDQHGKPGRPSYYEAVRDAGGPHAETPHVGLAAPVGGTAMAYQRYLHKYGGDPDKLAAVPVAQRRHAALNERAIMRAPLTTEQYLDARYIAEPLRLFDCSVVADGGIALIVTTAERARDLASPPVYLRGMQGLSGGPNEFIFGQPGLGINQADVFEFRSTDFNQRVFEMAGVAPEDVDVLGVFDSFSPHVLWALERFSFCGPGEALDFVQDGRIEIGGELPTNTSGGHLSEALYGGWNQMAELVRQVRGECGERQVVGARIGQYATAIGDSIIFGADAWP